MAALIESGLASRRAEGAPPLENGAIGVFVHWQNVEGVFVALTPDYLEQIKLRTLII